MKNIGKLIIVIFLVEATLFARNMSDCNTINCYEFTSTEKKGFMKPRYLTRKEIMYKNISYGSFNLEHNKSNPAFEYMTYGNFPISFETGEKLEAKQKSPVYEHMTYGNFPTSFDIGEKTDTKQRAPASTK